MARSDSKFENSSLVIEWLFADPGPQMPVLPVLRTWSALATDVKDSGVRAMLLICETRLNESCRIPPDYAVGRNIVYDHCTCRNDGARADGYARKNDSPVTNPYVVFNDGFGGIASRRVPNAQARDVISVVIASNECNKWRHQNVVPERNITVDPTVRPKLYPVSNLYVAISREDSSRPGNSDHSRSLDPTTTE